MSGRSVNGLPRGLTASARARGTRPFALRSLGSPDGARSALGSTGASRALGRLRLAAGWPPGSELPADPKIPWSLLSPDWLRFSRCPAREAGIPASERSVETDRTEAEKCEAFLRASSGRSRGSDGSESDLRTTGTVADSFRFRPAPGGSAETSAPGPEGLVAPRLQPAVPA